MIEFTYTEAYGFHHAIRGIRNSWGSHGKSDSGYKPDLLGGHFDPDIFVIGKNDLALCAKLAKAGASHRKYLRQVEIWVDINAPLYWWKEFDTYKIGTVANSESTMHTIQREEMVCEFFSVEAPPEYEAFWFSMLDHYEDVRQKFNATKDKKYWRYLIQILPSGWMQKRTTLLNYEVVANAYHDRKNHRLSEWHDFCRWAEGLPYSELITGEMK